MKKILVVGVILLFIGVSVAPSINFSVVKASNDNDLVEVTTQACGIQGFGNTTVKLTREQYQNLEQYLIEFRARLNQTSTREEAVPIFKEAVVELDTYGLLPRGMSVERVQRLVTGRYQNKDIMKLQEKLIHNHFLSLDNDSNYFCLVAGKATNSIVFGPLVSILVNEGLLYQLLISLFGDVIDVFIILFLFASSVITFVSPINLFGQMCFGYHMYSAHGVTTWAPSKGWIFSSGIIGKKTFNGDFYGRIYTIAISSFADDGGTENFIGMTGFCGLKFYIKSTDVTHFLGYCLEVNVN